MDIPFYFLVPPMQAVNGYFCAPTVEGHGALLIYDDRNELPPDCRELTDRLANAAEKHGAEVFLADLERPPSPAAYRFVSEMAKRMRTAAPGVYCKNTGAEPILCYDPGMETFEAFVGRLPDKCWLELRPVGKTIKYSAALPAPPKDEADFFSGELGCRYRLTQREDGCVLRLYDTAETMHARLQGLAPRLYGAVGLRNELEDMGFP